MNLEFIKVTEAGALAASKYIGSGDKFGADNAATESMRRKLNEMPFCGKVILGEGEKDKMPGIFTGEVVGKYQADTGEQFDIVVDPLDGTKQTVSANGKEAVSVIAIGEENCFLPINSFYMNKIAVGKRIGNKVSLNNEISDNIKIVQSILGKLNINVCVLDRERHNKIVETAQLMGCNLIKIPDCDVGWAIETAMPSNKADLFIGIGGSSEGLLAAAALKCMGGYFECQPVDNEFNPIDKIYKIEELCRKNVIVCLSGILDGVLLEGIKENSINSIMFDSRNNSIRRFNTFYF